MEKHGTDNVQDTLAEREVQHGPFREHAMIESVLRNILEDKCENFTSVQYIALGMIMHKIARILNGGQQHSDTWQDIAGYALLAEKDILDE